MAVFGLVAIVLTIAPSGALSKFDRMARPPELVGPPRLSAGPCPMQVTTPGGTTSGAAIPISRLRLGATVERNAMSFPAGGGGTAYLNERRRRMLAGLQYDPRTFDPAAKALPSVFAAEQSQVAAQWIYQQLPLVSDGSYRENGMIFAQATSGTTGRIASLALVLASRPRPAPKLTVTAARPLLQGCQPDNPVDVYAPAMTATQLRRLFGRSSCRWNNLAGCARSEWPRGQVLFVQKQGSGYEHRWVDYDVLASAEPRKIAKLVAKAPAHAQPLFPAS